MATKVLLDTGLLISVEKGTASLADVIAPDDDVATALVTGRTLVTADDGFAQIRGLTMRSPAAMT